MTCDVTLKPARRVTVKPCSRVLSAHSLSVRRPPTNHNILELISNCGPFLRSLHVPCHRTTWMLEMYLQTDGHNWLQGAALSPAGGWHQWTWRLAEGRTSGLTLMILMINLWLEMIPPHWLQPQSYPRDAPPAAGVYLAQPPLCRHRDHPYNAVDILTECLMSRID